MITLYFEINNVNSILEIYNQIQIIRYIGPDGGMSAPVGEPDLLEDWVSISGSAPYTAPVTLLPSVTSYYVYDGGDSFDWYSSRYVDSSNPSVVNSGWSTPVLGDGTALYTNPLYPSEVTLTSSEKIIVDRLRLLVGDPPGLVHEFGEEYISNFHPGGRVYTLGEKGWPISVNMSGQQYTSMNNPTVNGYRYLKFLTDVSVPTTVSGVTYGLDVWYYTFRHSDRELLHTYDNTPVPEGLTTTNTTTDAYILSAAIDLLRSELWLDLTEAGSIIVEDKSIYNPTSALETRRKLLTDLENRLGKIVRMLLMANISGVLVD